MMFASKTPHDLNHDPLPFVWNGHSPQARKRDDTRTKFRVSPDYERAPRPEFDHVQHNEPNPILVAFRAQGDATYPDEWIAASWAASQFGGYTTWEDERSYFHAFTIASDCQIRHARKVLNRVQQIAEVSA